MSLSLCQFGFNFFDFLFWFLLIPLRIALFLIFWILDEKEEEVSLLPQSKNVAVDVLAKKLPGLLVFKHKTVVLSLISFIVVLILKLVAVNFEADLGIHEDELAHPEEDGDVYVNHVSED